MQACGTDNDGTLNIVKKSRNLKPKSAHARLSELSNRFASGKGVSLTSLGMALRRIYTKTR
jgi:hypothetical protein